ncbi:MAG: translation elongation factor Ts, partial [Bacillota bacterium]|nr:translation elongation factor Ts [Bacillota bacterium]
AARVAAEGLIRIATSDDGKSAALVEVNSETDFVAKNPEFISFVEDMAKLALDAKNTNMDDFKAMNYDGATVGDALTAKIAKIGENLSLRRIDKASGDVLATYIHGGGRIGVVVVGKGDTSDNAKAALTNVAMQVAAMNPQYVSREDISADELDKLKNITIESSLNDPFNLPKPILNALLDKAVNGVWSEEDTAILNEKRADKGFNFNFITNFISDEAKAKLAELSVANREDTLANKIFAGAIEGRVAKQLKEICLLDQTYVKAEDGKQTVSQYLATVNKDLALVKVLRFEVGEGIEKKEENFAEEVAKQMQG